MSENKETLSGREREVLESIEIYTDKYGFPPTVRDICSSLRIQSTSVVYDNLRGLVTKGYLVKHNKTPRGIKVIKHIVNE